jgi:hypothetical protein
MSISLSSKPASAATRRATSAVSSVDPLSTTIVCFTERSIPGSTHGSERASFLTRSTAVNPELEGPVTQFHRIAYSAKPSMFFHSAVTGILISPL